MSVMRLSAVMRMNAFGANGAAPCAISPASASRACMPNITPPPTRASTCRKERRSVWGRVVIAYSSPLLSPLRAPAGVAPPGALRAAR